MAEWGANMGEQNNRILNPDALRDLRALIAGTQGRAGRGVALAPMVAMGRHLADGVRLTIDFDAVAELGHPVVVLHAPVPTPEDAAAGMPAVPHAWRAVLSRREQQVALLVAQGLRNREIADRLYISLATVKDHVHNILEKTGIRGRTALAATLLGQR